MRKYVVYKNEKEYKFEYHENAWYSEDYKGVSTGKVKKTKWCEFENINRALESIVTLNHEAYLGRNKKGYEPYFFTMEIEE